MGKMLEAVISEQNLKHSLECMNFSACAGIDRQQPKSLKMKFSLIKDKLIEQIMDGTYEPQALLRVYIPKKGKTNEYRMLGIPTAKDRMVQGSIVSVLSPLYSNDFSKFSFGFIKGRNCYQALDHVLELANKGKSYVVSIDLKKFFDNVPHDTLISILQRKIKDEELLNLIQKYLVVPAWESNENGKRVKVTINKGVPQGGPLSPLLSNIVLNELDDFLENQNIKFCRYADDCLILATGIIEALDTFHKVTIFLENELKLDINYNKSYVKEIDAAEYLGYSFEKINNHYEFAVSDKCVQSLKNRMTDIIANQYQKVSHKEFIKKIHELTRGWINYYHKANMLAEMRQIDEWFKNTIINIHRFDQSRHQRNVDIMQEIGVDIETAVRLSNVDNVMEGKPIQGKKIPSKKYYAFLRQSGYTTCEEFYISICEKKEGLNLYENYQ